MSIASEIGSRRRLRILPRADPAPTCTVFSEQAFEHVQRCVSGAHAAGMEAALKPIEASPQLHCHICMYRRDSLLLPLLLLFLLLLLFFLFFLSFSFFFLFLYLMVLVVAGYP